MMSPMEPVRGHLYGFFQNKFLYGNCSGDKKESSKKSPMNEISQINEGDLIFQADQITPNVCKKLFPKFLS